MSPSLPAAVLGAVAIALLGTSAAGEDPKPERRLKLDLERLARERLEREEKPRFEEHVEVTARATDQLLGRFVEGADLDCEAAGVGAPTEQETREVRPGPGPYVDFMALARAAVAKLKKKGRPRFFLYRVTRAGQRRYLVREGEAPAAWQLGPDGAVVELVESFPDQRSALAAWQRLERGLEGPPSDASPTPPFLPSCKPGR
jgi:hypothetical protein